MDKLDEVETEKAGSSDEEVSTKQIINSGTLDQGTQGSPCALLDFLIRNIKCFPVENLFRRSCISQKLRLSKEKVILGQLKNFKSRYILR